MVKMALKPVTLPHQRRESVGGKAALSERGSPEKPR
jgi:hypothetical protein